MNLRFSFPTGLAAAAVLLPLMAVAAYLPARSPFGVAVAPAAAPGGAGILRVDFTVPRNCVINVDRLHFRATDGTEIRPVSLPECELEVNPVDGRTNRVFPHDFAVLINLADLTDHQLAVKFQGCTNGECYFPEQRLFAPNTTGSFAEVSTQPVIAAVSGTVDWARAFDGFQVRGQQTGYLNPGEFSAFLDQSVTGGSAADPLQKFQKMGLWATLLLIVVGGVLLNFTPCILPMIPINLAIIGAGREAKTRMAGFKKGLIYGLGMALAYGTLGLVVVLSGSKFGTLNSSVGFNLSIAVVFVVMALGMFDVVSIDLSRFSGTRKSSRLFWLAVPAKLAENAVILSMGIMSALLAGACVAPVVISVILLATNLYAKGTMAGLALPFLLGMGMALPWPFAGAGLTFMPKPGKWMKHVKHGFGILILGFAAYYGHLAWHAHQTTRQAAAAKDSGAVSGSSAEVAQLLAAVQSARQAGRPLFVDFHASWCKDCSAMDETVFNRSEVKKKLEKFVAVRYGAEKPGEAPDKTLLDHFNIVGLPTYLVLSPK